MSRNGVRRAARQRRDKSARAPRARAQTDLPERASRLPKYGGGQEANLAGDAVALNGHDVALANDAEEIDCKVRRSRVELDRLARLPAPRPLPFSMSAYGLTLIAPCVAAVTVLHYVANNPVGVNRYSP